MREGLFRCVIWWSWLVKRNWFECCENYDLGKLLFYLFVYVVSDVFIVGICRFLV